MFHLCFLNKRIRKGCGIGSFQKSNVVFQLTVPINTCTLVISCVLGFTWKRESKWRSPKGRGYQVESDLPTNHPGPAPSYRVLSLREVLKGRFHQHLLQPGKNCGWWAGAAETFLGDKVALLPSSGVVVITYLQQYFIFSFWFAVFLSTRFMRNFSFPSPSLHPSIRADFLADSGGAPPMPCHPKWSSIGFLEPVLSYPSSICVDISLSWPLPCPSLLITLWYF